MRASLRCERGYGAGMTRSTSARAALDLAACRVASGASTGGCPPSAVRCDGGYRNMAAAWRRESLESVLRELLVRGAHVKDERLEFWFDMCPLRIDRHIIGLNSEQETPWRHRAPSSL